MTVLQQRGATGTAPVPRWAVPAFSTVAAAVWLIVVAMGGTADIAVAGAAAAAGVAVLVAAVAPPLTRESLPAAGPALVVVTVVAALPPSGRAVWPLVLAVVALASHLLWTQPGLHAGVATAGAALLALGTALDSATATLAGIVLLAGVGDAAARLRHTAAPLLPLALVVGLFSWDPSTAATAFLAAAALVAAAVSPALGVAFVALAITAVSAPAAVLMASAAVLAAGIRQRAVTVLALPGAIAAVTAIAARPATVASVVTGAAIAGVAGMLAYPSVALAARRRVARTIASFIPRREARSPAAPSDKPPRVASLPAIAAGSWLFLAPATWTWTGVEGLRSYTEGALIAAASASIAVVVAWMLGLVAVRLDRLDW